MKRELLPPVRSFEAFAKEEQFVLALFSRLATIKNVRVVYPHLALCDDQTCRYSDGDKPMYSDAVHLSPVGVEQLYGMLGEIFSGGVRKSIE